MASASAIDLNGPSDTWKSFLDVTESTQTPPSTFTLIPSAGDPTTGPNLSIKSPQFWDLTFDTQENQARFQDSGYMVDGSVLLGLSATLPASLSLNLDSVLTSFGIAPEDRSGNGLFTNILQALGDEFPLLIDGTDQRNAMWLSPGMTPRIDTALCFTADLSSGVVKNISDALNSEFNFTIPNLDISIYVQRTSFGLQYTDSSGSSQWSVRSNFCLTLKLKIPNPALNIWLILKPTGVTISITQPSNNDLIGALISLGRSDTPIVSSMLGGLSILKNIIPLRATLEKDSTGKIHWGIVVVLQRDPPHAVFGSDTAPLQLYFAFDSNSGTFVGGLVTSGFYVTGDTKKSPDYQLGMDLEAPTDVTIPDSWDVRKLSSELDTIPDGLPTAISSAVISYYNKTLIFSASLISPPPLATTGPKVPFPLTWDELDVSITKGDTVFACSASTNFTLRPQTGDESKYSPATLSVAVNYSKSDGWDLSCHVENLQFGILAGYFDPNYREPLLSILGRLAIKSLDVDYTFNADRSASSFYMSGDIVVGGLEMVFRYQYARSDAEKSAAAEKLPADKVLTVKSKGTDVTTDWQFDADLGPSQSGTTVGSIADSIMPGASSRLPDFVNSVEINPPSGNSSAVNLEVSKTSENGTNQAIFSLKIQIGSFQVTCVQICGSVKGQDQAKQLLRVSVDTLPKITGIPLVDELTQPFQALAYHFVRDTNGTGGLTEAEVTAINTLLPDNPVLYKSTTSNRIEDKGIVQPAASTAASAVVMASGHHFVVIENNEAVLDHCFNNAKSGKTDQEIDKAKAKAGNPPPEPEEAKSDPPEEPTDPAPAKGTLDKKTSVLTLSALAVQFKSGSLWITMDATVTLGPMTVSLLGFGIGVPMSDFKLNKLSSLTGSDLEKLLSDIQFQLHGMELTFNKPPMLISGVFEHDTVTNGNLVEDYYRGGVAITIPPYAFLAVGEESVVTDKTNSSSFNSVFIYGRLDGPIIQLEIASIKGIRLGFGVNSLMRTPGGNQLYQYPLIADTGASTAGNSPAKILEVLTVQAADGSPPWIDVKKDAWWFAFGLTLDACDVMDVTAVVLVAFKDPAIVFTFLGDAVVQMPAKDAPVEEALLYVEMNIIAEMSIVWEVNQVPGVSMPVPIPTGYFRCELALAPTSFVLVPFCHIYGGFAVCFWFGIPGVTDHVGDFVYSIGGYHPAFDVPAWYPTVKRLGMAMTIGDNINVTGEAYFAVCAKAAMIGGLLRASLSVGPVDAYMEAQFDAMINFSPIHYRADIRVSVGVEFNMDFLFVHIHISCHVGADLHIAGPDFGGCAHVDFYLFGFDIYFGNQNDIPPPLSLADFWKLVHKLAPPPTDPKTQNTDEKVTRAIDDEMCNITFSLEDGAFVMPSRDPPPNADGTPAAPSPVANTGANSTWTVKGGTFQFRMSTEIPLSQAYVRYHIREDGSTPAPAEGVATTTPGTSVQPTTALSPADLNDDDDPNRFPIIPLIPLNPVYAKPMHLDATTTPLTSKLTFQVKDHLGNLVDDWQIFYLRAPVPTTTWGIYDQGKDPNHVSASDALAGVDNTVMLATALSVHSPAPILSKSHIPDFNATAAARLQIPRAVTIDEDGNMTALPWQLPIPDPTQTEGLPGDTFEAYQPLATQWSGVQSKWTSSYKKDLVGDRDVGMLAVAAVLLGWDQLDPGQNIPAPGNSVIGVAAGIGAGPRKSWELVGDFPVVLVGDGKDVNKGLDEYYLGLPRMSDGVGVLGATALVTWDGK